MMHGQTKINTKKSKTYLDKKPVPRKTSAWKHTAFPRDRIPWPRRESNPQP